MNCQDIKSQLSSYVYDDISSAERSAVDEHLLACHSCSDELRKLHDTRKVLGLWHEATVPAALHEKLLRVKDQPVGWVSRLVPKGMRDFVWGSAMPAVFGLSAAVIVIGLTIGRSSAESLSPWPLLLCGIVWGEVYNSLFQRIFLPAAAGRSIRTAKGAMPLLRGFAAFAIALGLALLTPNPEPFETRPFFYEISKRMPFWISYILPFLWSVIALACVLPGLCRRAGADVIGKVSLACMTYAVLMILDLVTYSLFEPYATFQLAVIWSLGVVIAAAIAVGLVAAVERNGA